MPIFIQLQRKDREDIFSVLKEKYSGSWEKIYPIFGISRAMFFNYLSGRNLIPFEIFILLQEKTGMKVINCKKIIRNKYTEKIIKLPKMNSDFCEILGVLNGDGHVSGLNYEISVVGNLHETEYAKYLKNLLEDRLNLQFRLTLEPTKFKIRTYSKKLALYLHKEYGLPLGNKMGSLRVPQIIKAKKERIYPYIRGLFDTDGCFHIRRKKDPMISIASADPRYLEDVRIALESIGIRVAKGDQRIFIYNKDDITLFFKKIKPANTKHLKKYQEYLKLDKALIV